MIEKVYEITTETGRRIVRNGHHPLYAAIKWSESGAHPLIDVKDWSSVVDMQKWLTQPPEYQKSKFTYKAWTTKRKKHSLLCAVPEEIPVFGDDVLPEHEIKLLAYLIGDGGLTQNQITFTQQNNAQLREFRECAEKVGCILKQSTSNEYTYRVVNPERDRRTNLKSKSIPGLKEKKDFTLEGHHISVKKAKQLTGHKDCRFYQRLKILNIKP
ncbi:MAG: hypothetical protein AAFY41_17820 [Bacteroidota bacterium]